MGSVNTELVAAVTKFNDAEQAVRDARIEMAKLFKEASRTQSITDLSRLTKINRTTIYWLMETWSNTDGSNNGNRDNQSQDS